MMRLSSADDTAIRLHLNESVHGASPRALETAHRALADISIYPDPARTRLSEAIARHLGLADGQVVVANGSDELVMLTALAVGGDGPGLVTDGTFPGYRTCLETVGRPVLSTPLEDFEGFLAAMPKAGIAFYCNPHNPTGATLSRERLDRLVDTAARSGVPLVLDEAYLEFAPEGIPQGLHHMSGEAPLITLRTFSKAHGLAALRIGYALGSAELLRRIRVAQGAMPFSANRIAQETAITALDDTGHIRQVRERNAARRDWFCAQLAARGRSFLPSAANFVAVSVSDGKVAQDTLERDHRILVRDAGLFGFPGYLRVSLGAPEHLTRLLDVLDVLDPITGR